MKHGAGVPDGADNKSRLVQARGLKRSINVPLRIRSDVAPRTGAWIETNYNPEDYVEHQSSRLVQARGLKQAMTEAAGVTLESRLVQARGLKRM